MPATTAFTAAHARLDSWLSSHHGVVADRDLRRLGVSRHYARSQARARRWRRVHAGVWCAYTGPLTFMSRCAAALAALGDTAALDGPSAAAVLGFRRGRVDGPVHVVIPHGTRRRSLPSVVVRQSRTLTDRSCVFRNGLRVVRIERAVLAMAAKRGTDAAAVVTEAVQQGLTVAERLRGTLLALGNVAGRSHLLEAIGDADGGSRSGLEVLFMRIIRRARLPVPVQNFGLVVDGRRLWLDVCYPALRIAVEIDGKAYHLFSEDWENDLDRQNALVLDGWLVLRFSARAIRGHPDDVARRVAKAVAERSASIPQRDRSAGAA